tara:strand:+ start:75 stop:707 length:633 start_codon:yes stop_codon:yes gene_type:complete
MAQKNKIDQSDQDWFNYLENKAILDSLLQTEGGGDYLKDMQDLAGFAHMMSSLDIRGPERYTLQFAKHSTAPEGYSEGHYLWDKDAAAAGLLDEPKQIWENVSQFVQYPESGEVVDYGESERPIPQSHDWRRRDIATDAIYQLSDLITGARLNPKTFKIPGKSQGGGMTLDNLIDRLSEEIAMVGFKGGSVPFADVKSKRFAPLLQLLAQ